jgi:hypothetical protein
MKGGIMDIQKLKYFYTTAQALPFGPNILGGK